MVFPLFASQAAGRCRHYRVYPPRCHVQDLSSCLDDCGLQQRSDALS
jgi:hypothetical protein